MRVERALLEELSEKVFNIGYQGELNHTQVIISCPVMFRDYPDAVASMVVKPPQGDLYPVSLTRDGNDLTWDVSASDVAIPGAGILQLTFTDGEGEEAEIIKTVYGNYSVNASLVANGDAPDPVQSWLDEAGAALATFENEIGDIRKITTATEEDEGLALSPKTVVNGKVTEWEYIDLADPEVVTQAIDDWLDDHPEATTTVEDGAITEAKLNDSLKADLAWQDDLDDVKNALSESKAPVILDTASGDIVTVPDGADGMAVETLTVAIEPVQDLHGYDNPWPGGGNGNVLDINNTFVVNSNTTMYGSEINISSGTTIYFQRVGGTNSMLYGRKSDGSYFEIGLISNSKQSAVLAQDLTAIGISTGAKAEYGTNDYVMVSLSSYTTPVPYANLCPISGWSAAEVTRTGFNLFNKATITDNKYINSGGSEQPSNQMVHSDYIRVLPNTTYYTNASAVGMFYTVVLYDIYKNHIGYKAMSAPGTFNTGNASYIIVNTAKAQTSVDDCVVNISDSSKNGQYEPYSGQTKTYTFPAGAGTVYGGTLTVNQDGSGELVVDMAYVDLSTLSWTNKGTYIQTDDLKTVIMKPASGSDKADIVSDHYGASGWAGTAPYSVAISPSSGAVAITSVSTAEGNMAYKMATPTTYNLTSLEVIELLKGVNNLWADCGNVTMQYPCDTKLFIERLTAPSEDDYVANANITSGTFFMVGNNLYISTSAIAQGETITPGTNCTAVNLADALNAINQ